MATVRPGRRTGRRSHTATARADARPRLCSTISVKMQRLHSVSDGFEANWMPDSKTVVTNGLNGQDQVMVRFSLATPRKVIEQSTEYEFPSSPSFSGDGKEILFIAKRPTPGFASLITCVIW